MEDRRRIGYPSTFVSIDRCPCGVGLLLVTSLHIRHTSTLGQKLLIRSQGCKNVGLPKRQSNFVVVLIIADHQVFDLAAGQSMSVTLPR